MFPGLDSFVLASLEMGDKRQHEKIIFVGSLLGFLWQEPQFQAGKAPVSKKLKWKGNVSTVFITACLIHAVSNL